MITSNRAVTKLAKPPKEANIYGINRYDGRRQNYLCILNSLHLSVPHWSHDYQANNTANCNGFCLNYVATQGDTSYTFTGNKYYCLRAQVRLSFVYYDGNPPLHTFAQSVRVVVFRRHTEPEFVENNNNNPEFQTQNAPDPEDFFVIADPDHRTITGQGMWKPNFLVNHTILEDFIVETGDPYSLEHKAAETISGTLSRPPETNETFATRTIVTVPPQGQLEEVSIKTPYDPLMQPLVSTFNATITQAGQGWHEHIPAPITVDIDLDLKNLEVKLQPLYSDQLWYPLTNLVWIYVFPLINPLGPTPRRGPFVYASSSLYFSEKKK